MQEFTVHGYKHLLNQFRSAGYKFLLLKDYSDVQNMVHPIVMMRHDVDIDLKLAFRIARIEHDEGICSTFFVCLRSPFYNLLSDSSARILYEIHKLGHDIAPHVVLAKAIDAHRFLEFDTQILAESYPFVNTTLISIHSPRDQAQIRNLLQVAGIAQVYCPILDGSVHYFSDSGGRWQSGHPCDSECFRKKHPMHLLTHPVWWAQEGHNSLDKLQSVISANSSLALQRYKEFLPKLLGYDGEDTQSSWMYEDIFY